jgi:hypothetical protein
MYYVEAKKKPTRVTIEVAADGKKTRKSTQLKVKI